MDELIAQIQEQAAETQRELADILGQITEKQRAHDEAWNLAWREGAQEAWDQGGTFYQPVIAAFTLGQSKTPRAELAERALEAITAVGWQLHTWAVSIDSKGSASAHPLFVRGDTRGN